MNEQLIMNSRLFLIIILQELRKIESKSRHYALTLESFRNQH